jgi:hypothetical protein
MVAMSADTRVCPFCGEPPGAGVFCVACGRNLAAVDRLPTRTEWEFAGAAAAAPAGDGLSVEERCAAATAGFLAAMREAGFPGVVKMPSGKAKAFGRTPTLSGWIVRPVQRDEDNLIDSRHDTGLFLTVEGTWHLLDNEVRGWGQRDFPQFQHSVEAQPLAPPADGRVPGELAMVLHSNGVGEKAGSE